MTLFVWPITVAAFGGIVTLTTGGIESPSDEARRSAPFGYLYAPAFSLQVELRQPLSVYTPQAGDVLLMSDTDCFWTLMYRFALTGAPGHAGIVVPLPDGRLGLLEAGYNETLWTRITPLAERLPEYPGFIWVRQRQMPLTLEQQQRLMEFALAAADLPYATGRVLLQVTPFRSRGPLRTYVLGRPRGAGRRYQCAEAVIEALVYAGVRDGRTARPAATYPQDLFYDRSWNRYLDRHPPLGPDWNPPALWTPIPGVALKGRTRKALAAAGLLPIASLTSEKAGQPDALGLSHQSAGTNSATASVVRSCGSDGSGGCGTAAIRTSGVNQLQPGTGVVEQAKAQFVVPLLGAEAPAVALVEQPLKRLGLFDRPPRLGRRR
ncbi:MAG: hypothetical protein NZ703_03430 [Gemmataceae bacterium]|nr:hypothetical protein [Gemmataceae bacterium]